MANNRRRIPLELDLDIEFDKTLWEALEPLIKKHRASAFIRSAVAHALGVGEMPMPVRTPPLALEETISAKRPSPVQVVQHDLPPSADTENSIDQATANFLGMFG